MPTTPAQLITEAKRLQRLQTKRRHAKRTLKGIEDEIKLVRRNIRALSNLDPEQQLPPGWKGKIE
jgi:hypothetical protein